MIYLDANASEPPRPAAIAAMTRTAGICGNPSSVHRAGRAARRLLEEARELIAGRFGALSSSLVFTSGATEAISLAVHGLASGRRIIVGATEHDAVRSAASGATTLPVDAEGRTDMVELRRMLPLGGPALVCVMLANNETGTIQDIPAVAALCRAAGARLLVDAVQAVGRIAVDLTSLGVDALVVSSHKIGGPAGAGALLLAPSCSDIAPQIAGGGQERGRRGGTPALPAIVGFAAAVEAATSREPEPKSSLAGNPAASPCRAVDLASLRDQAERAAVDAGAVVLGGGGPRLANTACLALPGVRADTQVMALDLAGVCVSAGAACSSGKVARSHVLDAMGLGALAGEAIRVSLPWCATAADVAAFARAYTAMAERLRSRRAA